MNREELLNRYNELAQAKANLLEARELACEAKSLLVIKKIDQQLEKLNILLADIRKKIYG